MNEEKRAAVQPTGKRAGETAPQDQGPIAPTSIAETGLEHDLLLQLLLKTVYVTGRVTVSALADNLKLARSIVSPLLEDGKAKNLFEVLGTTGSSPLSELRYNLTGKGREWATEALDRSQYVGPAPVTLPQYRERVESQRIMNEPIYSEILLQRLSHLVIPDDLLDRVGAAIFSGRSMLFYGPPGNGKTSIATAFGGVYRQTVYVPHCIEVDGQIIKLFDATIHKPIASAPPESAGEEGVVTGVFRRPEPVDPRWLACRRPVVVVGGELTLDMLDLNFNPIAKFYEAPVQLKATNGLFIIDDFGRQLVSPQDLLNRWIVPMDQGVDYLTLHTGKKFPVSFDAVVAFSTNIPPSDLVDPGALRRIHSKIEVGPPTKEDFLTIFGMVCEEFGIELRDEVVAFLFEEVYGRRKVPIGRYHPRALTQLAQAICEYRRRPFRLDLDVIRLAVENMLIHH
jgi:energy-coupling factor transporter ATP-binding protein EcfA2